MTTNDIVALAFILVFIVTSVINASNAAAVKDMRKRMASNEIERARLRFRASRRNR